MPPTSGMRFGRYELATRIGAGGMGEVWRAHDQDLHRDVAVKFLPERFAADSLRLGRFSQEARAASSLNHPNIVTIHEIGETSGMPYIVMELVQGHTLRELVLDGRPLPVRRLLEIGAQMADGLAKAHAAGIVHRDLKPENVMVTDDGFVKILDFGLAKLRSDASGERQQWFDSALADLAGVALAADRGRRRARHRGLHVAGAGARSRRRLPWRPVHARRDPVRARDRTAGVPARDAAPRRSPRSSRPRPSRSPASTRTCPRPCGG